MTDTLRSIVESMEYQIEECPTQAEALRLAVFRDRLLALIAEAEQVDLVKTWNAEHDRHVKHYIDADSYERGIVDGKKVCADELATWLAVNKERIDADTLLLDSEARVERIKAEARLEEFKYCLAEICRILSNNRLPIGTLSEWKAQHIADLEAQAKPEESR